MVSRKSPAVANYNYGRKATLDIFVHMIPRFYTSKLCHTLNFRRKYNAALHSKPTITKVRRNLIRGEKKKIDNRPPRKA